MLVSYLGVRGSRYFDRWPGLHKASHNLPRLTTMLAVMGMAVSLLHQSSSGATYGVLNGKAIWFKPSLSVMFIISAVAGGMSLTFLATLITSTLTHRKLVNDKLKLEVARAIGSTTLVYLYRTHAVGGKSGKVVAASSLPSAIEILVAAGIVAYALLGFSLGAHFLPIFRPASLPEGGN